MHPIPGGLGRYTGSQRPAHSVPETVLLPTRIQPSPFRQATAVVTVVTFVIALAACSNGQEKPNAGEPNDPASATTNDEPPPAANEITENAVKYVADLWAKGSGFSGSIDDLLYAKEQSKTEIYGTVARVRISNVPGLANYQLYQYLIRVSRTSGQPHGAKFIPAPGADPSKSKARRTAPTRGWEPSPEHPDDGRIEDGPIGPGDYVWMNARVIGGDRVSLEQLVAKNDVVWACYAAMPLNEHNPFTSPNATPIAWTIRRVASRMASAMGS